MCSVIFQKILFSGIYRKGGVNRSKCVFVFISKIEDKDREKLLIHWCFVIADFVKASISVIQALGG